MNFLWTDLTVQGFFEVSVRFVAREVRGFFLTPSKKKTTRVKEEFELTQVGSSFSALYSHMQVDNFTSRINRSNVVTELKKGKKLKSY